jgi:hypothetical protein
MGLGCVKELPCREGSVYLNISLGENSSGADRLAVSYGLDQESSKTHELFPVTSPLIFPQSGKGILQLNIAHYSQHKKILLSYLPMRGTTMIGEWQEREIPLSQGCTAISLSVMLYTKDGGLTDKGTDSFPTDMVFNSIDLQVLDASSVTTDLTKSAHGDLPSIDNRTTETWESPRFDVPDVPILADSKDAGTGIIPDSEPLDSSINRLCDPLAPPLEDPLNCGTCGHKCSQDQVCGAGHCCPLGSAWCLTGDGAACIDVTYDSNNCGGCGISCSVSGKECCGGVCVYSITYQYDPKNCGVCGNICPVLGDGSDACQIWGNCKKATCGKNLGGFVVCNP